MMLEENPYRSTSLEVLVDSEDLLPTVAAEDA
jgi:hypothetical protein